MFHSEPLDSMTPNLHPRTSSPRTSKIVLVILVLLLLFTVSAIIILASVPPVDRDALTHHLFVPKLYLQHGGIYKIPEIPFSYYPMNLDLLYMIPLYYGNDIIPKYLHFLFALSTGCLIYAFLTPRLGRNWGLFSALFFLTIPVIIKLSITVYVDLGLIFFSTAALLSVIAWVNREFHWRYLILSGLLAGLAAGTKYNGLVTIVILALVAPFFFSRIASRNNLPQLQIGLKAVAISIVFVTASLATYSPWLIRNYIWTGNPVYPLHDQLFNKADRNALAESGVNATSDNQSSQESSAMNIFMVRKLVYGESAWQTLALPIRFFLEGQDDNPRFFDGKLSPFLLVFPLFALIGLRKQSKARKTEIALLSAFALLYFFFTFFQTAMRVRYISPSLPPLVLLAAIGLSNVSSILTKKPALHRAVIPATVTALAMAALIYNYVYLFQLFSKVNPIPYLSGTVSRAHYITSIRPEYPAIQWLNERTTSEDRVLCIFLGNRGYYMDFKPVFFSPYGSDLNKAVKETAYALIRRDLFIQWLQHATEESSKPINLPFDPQNPVFSSNSYLVYQL